MSALDRLMRTTGDPLLLVSRLVEGIEFHLIALALLLVILVRGSGPLSIDHARSTR